MTWNNIKGYLGRYQASIIAAYFFAKNNKIIKFSFGLWRTYINQHVDKKDEKAVMLIKYKSMVLGVLILLHLQPAMSVFCRGL